MTKETGKKEIKRYIIIAIAVVVLAAVVLIVLNSSDGIFSSSNGLGSNFQEISGAELIANKEKYEGKEVRLVNVLVPDPLFAYIDKVEGGKERLFIEPRKTTYCLNFNLDGTLQRDTTGNKEWIFHVSNFTCLKSS